MSKQIIPRGNQVLVKPKGEESRELDSGLLLPGNVEQEKKAIGKVIAVGPNVPDIKKDDEVLYGAFAGEQIKMKEDKKDVEYVLLFEEDVLAFLKKI